MEGGGGVREILNSKNISGKIFLEKKLGSKS
uniref:Uncharacterized protein n=1 Tax=viral metagenome TaxID=1070528 RepID=A0A6C0IZL7_9ZZZZ